MKSLKELSADLWDIASAMKQVDRSKYEEISDIAGLVHDHWERLNDAVGGAE